MGRTTFVCAWAASFALSTGGCDGVATAPNFGKKTAPIRNGAGSAEPGVGYLAGGGDACTGTVVQHGKRGKRGRCVLTAGHCGGALSRFTLREIPPPADGNNIDRWSFRERANVVCAEIPCCDLAVYWFEAKIGWKWAPKALNFKIKPPPQYKIVGYGRYGCTGLDEPTCKADPAKKGCVWRGGACVERGPQKREGTIAYSSHQIPCDPVLGSRGALMHLIAPLGKPIGCKGDSGGPALAGGKVDGVLSTSVFGGCRTVKTSAYTIFAAGNDKLTADAIDEICCSKKAMTCLHDDECCDGLVCVGANATTVGKCQPKDDDAGVPDAGTPDDLGANADTTPIPDVSTPDVWPSDAGSPDVDTPDMQCDAYAMPYM